MYSRSSFNRSLVQLEGCLLRVPIKVLQSEFERSAHIRNLFVSYSETLLAQIQQTVACNALHSTRQKMCRWLLMMHDRADGELLTYTHEFLAQVLGVNRKSVTLAAQALQREGLIDYHRDRLHPVLPSAPNRGIRAGISLDQMIGFCLAAAKQQPV
jgi:CRP-like cAMP-binding protein